MVQERTQFVPLPVGGSAAADRTHVLAVMNGNMAGTRWPLPDSGLSIGRSPPADVVLNDPAVSRLHCRVERRGNDVLVCDDGSTNGSFVDGRRVAGQAIWPVGSLLQVGSLLLQHDLASDAQLRRDDERLRDLYTALAYVRAQLPVPQATGPVAIDWHYVPSADLGGDAFGAAWLPDGRFCCYLIDVSGHGAGAAMHAVAVMNALRPQALGSVDAGDPAAVLARLNQLFPMEAHADMYFTIWYGVFDPATRRLVHAAAGHHPAYACVEGWPPQPLGTRNRMIGTPVARPFVAAEAVLPPATSLFVMSDGVFEIVDTAGRAWQMADFVGLLRPGPVGGLPRQYHDYMQQQVAHGRFDDDFTLLALHFA